MIANLERIKNSHLKSVSVLTSDMYDDLIFYTDEGTFILSSELIKNCYITEYPVLSECTIKDLKKIKDVSFSRTSEEGLVVYYRDINFQLEIEPDEQYYPGSQVFLLSWKAIGLTESNEEFKFYLESSEF